MDSNTEHALLHDLLTLLMHSDTGPAREQGVQPRASGPEVQGAGGYDKTESKVRGLSQTQTRVIGHNYREQEYRPVNGKQVCLE